MTRQRSCLNGTWKFLAVGHEGYGAQSFAGELGYVRRLLPEKDWDEILVPGFWNSDEYFNAFGEHVYFHGNRKGGAKAPYPALRGVGWYRKTIDVPARPGSDSRFFLCFEGVCAHAVVYLNGQEIGQHLGAYAAFEFDAMAAVKWGGANVLAVKVTSMDRFMVQAEKPDPETNAYGQHSLTSRGATTCGGGIWKSCHTEIRPAHFIKTVLVDTQEKWMRIRAQADAPAGAELHAEVIDPADGSIAVKLQATIDQDGKATVESRVEKAESWDPENPKLYNLRVTLQAGQVRDAREIAIGFRSFTIDKEKFVLNGKPYYIFGASHPADHLIPEDREVIRQNLQLLKDAGIRLLTWSEEPPPRAWLEEMDRLGMLSMNLSPIQWSTPPFDVAKREIAEWVTEQYNHPSNVIWALGHECSYLTHFNAGKQKAPFDTPKKYFMGLYEAVRQIDPYRPILNDYHTGIPDVGGDIDSYTEYHGSYHGTIETHWCMLRTPVLSSVLPSETPLPNITYEDRHWSGGMMTRTAPLIITEHIGLYSDPEDGHFYEKMFRMRRVGREENQDSAAFGQVCQEYKRKIAKESIEIMRAVRSREPYLAGFVPFMAANWFYHPLESAKISPKPIIGAIKEAYAPILVVPFIQRRHVVPGESLRVDCVVCNDARDGHALEGAKVSLHLQLGGERVALSPVTPIPTVPHYANHKWACEVTIPAEASRGQGRIEADLHLPDGSVLTNWRPIDVLPANFQRSLRRVSEGRIALFDPERSLATIAKMSGVATEEIGNTSRSIVLAPNSLRHLNASQKQTLRRCVEEGSRLLVLEQDAPYLPKGRPIFPQVSGTLIDWIGPTELVIIREHYHALINTPDYDDTVHLTDEALRHPIFEGIDPKTFRCFNGDGVIVSSYLQSNKARRYYPWRPHGFGYSDYRIEPDPAVSVLAEAYLYLRDYAVCEVACGKGNYLFSQVMATNKCGDDPVATQYVANCLRWVTDAAEQR